MRSAILTTLVLLAATLGFDNAKADPYGWCANYSGRTGGTNCYFMTLGQCRAAISGVGGICTRTRRVRTPSSRPPR